jgi:hypothetical protein
LEKEIPAVEKRLALFCLLAALILGGNLALQTWRQSSQEPAPAPNAPTAVADAANGDAANNAAANPNANSAADDSAADDSAGDDNGKPQVAAASTAATATDRPKDSPAKDQPPRHRLTRSRRGRPPSARRSARLTHPLAIVSSRHSTAWERPWNELNYCPISTANSTRTSATLAIWG